MLRCLFHLAAGLLLAAVVGCAGAPKYKASYPQAAPLPAASIPGDPLLPGPGTAPTSPAPVAPY
jgi:hypothetical protein